MEYDCRLTINRLGEFYLCIPKPLEIKADNQGPKFSVVEEKKGAGIISLDPGVREHSLLAITQMVKPLNGRKGILIEYIAYAYIMIGSKRKGFYSNKRKRYKLRRCMLRIHKKIRNLVDECHHRKFAR